MRSDRSDSIDSNNTVIIHEEVPTRKESEEDIETFWNLSKRDKLEYTSKKLQTLSAYMLYNGYEWYYGDNYTWVDITNYGALKSFTLFLVILIFVDWLIVNRIIKYYKVRFPFNLLLGLWKWIVAGLWLFNTGTRNTGNQYYPYTRFINRLLIDYTTE